MIPLICFRCGSQGEVGKLGGPIRCGKCGSKAVDIDDGISRVAQELKCDECGAVFEEQGDLDNHKKEQGHGDAAKSDQGGSGGGESGDGGSGSGQGAEKGEGGDSGKPPWLNGDDKKESALRRLVASILETNPNLSERTARRVATKTLERYPQVQASIMGDMWHELTGPAQPAPCAECGHPAFNHPNGGTCIAASSDHSGRQCECLHYAPGPPSAQEQAITQMMGSKRARLERVAEGGAGETERPQNYSKSYKDWPGNAGFSDQGSIKGHLDSTHSRDLAAGDDFDSLKRQHWLGHVPLGAHPNHSHESAKTADVGAPAQETCPNCGSKGYAPNSGNCQSCGYNGPSDNKDEELRLTPWDPRMNPRGNSPADPVSENAPLSAGAQ